MHTHFGLTDWIILLIWVLVGIVAAILTVNTVRSHHYRVELDPPHEVLVIMAIISLLVGPLALFLTLSIYERCDWSFFTPRAKWSERRNPFHNPTF